MKKIAILFLFLATSCGFSKNNKKETVVTISTEFGDMKLLLSDETPKHKENFIKLANEGFFDSTTFHRVMPQFMIQGGDPNSKDENPNNDGQGGPGYTIDAEIKRDLLHFKGALAAARMPDQVNPQKKSSGSQFYIVEGVQIKREQMDQLSTQRGWSYTEEEMQKYESLGGYPWLDMDYTVFGTVISGLDLVQVISKQPRNRANRPNKNVYMKVTVEEMKRKKIEKEFDYTFPTEKE